MTVTYNIVLVGCLLAEAAANFASHGAHLVLDSEADTVAIRLSECHNSHKQRFRIVNNQFRSLSKPDFCLTYEGIDNALQSDVDFVKCDPANKNQVWDFKEDHLVVKGTGICLDVKKVTTPGGVQVAVPHTSECVWLPGVPNPPAEVMNQRWSWVHCKHGNMVEGRSVELTEHEYYDNNDHHHHEYTGDNFDIKDHHSHNRRRRRHHHHHHHNPDHVHTNKKWLGQKWGARDLGLSRSAPVITVALAGAVAVGLFSLGALTVKRMRMAAEMPLASLSEE